MKKLARILALTLVIVMAFCLVGCGPKSKIKGEWEGEIMGIECTLEFDGKGEMTMTMAGQEQTLEYEFEGKKLFIDGEEQEYEFEGSKTLILELDGKDVEFTKK